MPSTAAATEVPMPRLSDSMEEGTILKWLLASGEEVAAGQDLVEIETDKANMTYQADRAGVLEVLAEEGATLAVGEPIARIGAEAPREASERSTPEAEPSPEPEPEAKPSPEPEAEPSREPETPPQAARPTPLARRAAQIHGVELDLLQGAGPGGRVTKADVLQAAGIEPGPPRGPAAQAPAHTAAAARSAAAGAKGEVEIVEPTRAQALLARRMAEAKATVPHFQVQTEASVESIASFRERLKREGGKQPVPSLNDFVIKAAAHSLARHPKANGSFRDGRFELYERVNVGVAVAAEGALLVPVIADADRLSLTAIAAESRRLAERVRAGEVTPPELAGGTFTVSNLGMFGMTAIVPVINPPQAAILGVGAAREVLRRSPDGEILADLAITLTLSCDHRILYGAEAASFLADLRHLLEDPLLLA